MICRICGYSWRPRVKYPIACPKCKRYLGERIRWYGEYIVRYDDKLAANYPQPEAQPGEVRVSRQPDPVT